MIKLVFDSTVSLIKYSRLLLALPFICCRIGRGNCFHREAERTNLLCYKKTKKLIQY